MNCDELRLERNKRETLFLAINSINSLSKFVGSRRVNVSSRLVAVMIYEHMPIISQINNVLNICTYHLIVNPAKVLANSMILSQGNVDV